MDILTIILIVVAVVLFLALQITFGVICAQLAGRKGWSVMKNFWFGFFLGIIAIIFVEIKPARSFAWNPNLRKELMYLTYLQQTGAISKEDLEREKQVLQWMNHYM